MSGLCCCVRRVCRSRKCTGGAASEATHGSSLASGSERSGNEYSLNPSYSLQHSIWSNISDKAGGGHEVSYFIKGAKVISKNSVNKYNRLTHIMSNIDDEFEHLDRLMAHGHRHQDRHDQLMDHRELNNQQSLYFVSLFRLPRRVLFNDVGLPEDNKKDLFQAIFCSHNDGASKSKKPRPRRTRLKIVFFSIRPDVKQHFKSATGRVIYSDTVCANAEILRKSIEDNTQNGERFVCVQKTGDVKFSRRKSPSIRVDFFFEVPCCRRKTSYQYVYSVIEVTTQRRVKLTRHTSDVTDTCDHLSVFMKQLLHGWRLVDILTDKDDYVLSTCRNWDSERHTLWFYEKPQFAANDFTQRYQGKVLEFLVTICNHTPLDPEWEPVITRMGATGWELATILETFEEKHLENNAEVVVKCLMFFQRDISLLDGDVDRGKDSSNKIHSIRASRSRARRPRKWSSTWVDRSVRTGMHVQNVSKPFPPISTVLINQMSPKGSPKESLHKLQ